MRKAITFLLLAASAASPLAAQAWIGPGQGPDRADRDSGRREAERPRDDRGPADRRDWRDGRDNPGAADRIDPREQDARTWNGGRGPDDRAGRDWNDGRGPGDRAEGDRNDPRGGRFDDRPGRDGNRTGAPRPDDRWSENRRGGWDGRWRDDRRYDWQGYRAGNRAIFRAPRYYGPRGYDYSRWSRGYRVEPFFYGRNYWIADPWRYRLPPAYGSYRWVRYYDDVALIDTRNGLIEDILYAFFLR